MSKVSIILLGESGVGKTTLLVRYDTGVFKEQLRLTFMDLHTKTVNIEGRKINLHIWDTSGQERYNSVVQNYYRKADGVLLVYDVTDPSSFYKLSKWLTEVKHFNETAQILIAGNKNEDQSKKDVTVSMVRQFAKTEGLEYMEMSAKSGENVEEAFRFLMEKVLIAKGVLEGRWHSSATIELSGDQSGRDSIILHETEIVKKKKGSCSC